MHYAYDLEAAKKLLDEAGLKPDANGIRFKATMDAPTYSPDGLGRVADYLKVQLKKIGIEIDRRISPDSATWAQRLSNYDYDIAMSQIYNYPDPVIGTHRLFLCKNQIKGVMFTNTGGYCNEKVDEIWIRPRRKPTSRSERHCTRSSRRSSPRIFPTSIRRRSCPLASRRNRLSDCRRPCSAP